MLVATTCTCVSFLDSQALEVIRLLKPTMEIERAQMRLKLTLPAKEARRVREKISGLITIEQEDWTSDLEIVSTAILACSCVGLYVALCPQWLASLVPRLRLAMWK